MAPDGDGRWLFALNSQIAVSFERDVSGRVVAMKLYQQGAVFELPRLGVDLPPEIPLDQLCKYLGSYYGEELKETVEIVIKNNYLTLKIPGQKTYELRPPDAKGKRAFRVYDGIAICFNESDTGDVKVFTYYEKGSMLEYSKVAADSSASRRF